MVRTADALTGADERLRTWLRASTFGSLTPVEVAMQRDEDADGNLALFIDVTLPDPNPDEETWPVEDLFRMDREVRDKALELGVAYPWYLRPRPATDDAADTDETGTAHPTSRPG